MLGRLEDARKAITLEFKLPGSKIYLVGERKDELGGSEYYRLLGHLGANVPKPDFKEVRRELSFITRGINAGLILSAHDISDGGLAVCLAEMCFGGRGKGKIGAKVDLSSLGNLPTWKKLFSETGGFLIEASDEVELRKLAGDLPLYELGLTTEEDTFEIKDGGSLIKTGMNELRDLWLNGLRNIMNS